MIKSSKLSNSKTNMVGKKYENFLEYLMKNAANEIANRKVVICTFRVFYFSQQKSSRRRLSKENELIYYYENKSINVSF